MFEVDRYRPSRHLEIPPAFGQPISAWSEPRGWRRPIWLVALVLVAISYPYSSNSAEVSLAKPTPADAAAVLLLAVVGWQLLSSEHLARLRSPWLLPPIAIAFAASISTLASHDPVLSVAGLVRVLELFVFVPVAVMLAIRDRQDMRIAMLGVVGVALFEGGIGLYQFATGSGAGFGNENIRAVGTYGPGDQLAMSTLVSVALLICVAAAFTLNGRARVYALVVGGVLLLALLASLSRGSLLSAGVAIFLMAAFAGFRRLFLLLFTVALAGILLLGVADTGNSVIAERYGTVVSTGNAPDRSVQDRYDLWGAAVSMWETSPVTGVGVKNFALFRDGEAPLAMSSGADAASGKDYVRVQLLSPHNEYLLILSEQGILGFVALLALMFVVVIGPLRRLPTSSRPMDRWIVLALVGIGIRDLVDFAYGDVAGPSALFTATLFGLALRVAAGAQAESR